MGEVKYLKFKLEHMLKKEAVTVYHGTYKGLFDHPILANHSRSIVALESNNTLLISKFNTVSANFQEKYAAFRVTVKDLEQAIDNDNYDNCYVINPGGS